METVISTMTVRQHLGDILNRVSLRHDRYIIERKGEPLAVLMPVEKAEIYEKAARENIFSFLKNRKDIMSDSDAMKLADDSKHEARKG